MTAFVSMHQDVWSRYSGGSGAPAWTLEVVGFDLHAIEDTGGAWLHGQRGGGHVEAERGLWPCGYHKLVASTMSCVVRFSFPVIICFDVDLVCNVVPASGREMYTLQNFSSRISTTKKSLSNNSSRTPSWTCGIWLLVQLATWKV